MKTLEYVEEIDETLSRWEDYFHGQEGIDLTEARNNLDKIRKQLILSDVVGQSGHLVCEKCKTAYTKEELEVGHCFNCGEMN
jgi:uncharacterized protein YbaR (Trm112 family)